MAACQYAGAQYLSSKNRGQESNYPKRRCPSAKVEITKESAKGSQMMVAESAQISSTIFEVVGQTLQQKKISVLKSPFDAQAEAMDDEHNILLQIYRGATTHCCPNLLGSQRTLRKRAFLWATSDDT